MTKINLTRMSAPSAAEMPDVIMAWHSHPDISHIGTWAATRYPEDAVAYVPQARIAELEAEVAELTEVLNSIEVKHGITDNGNLWRFWSRKAREMAEKGDGYRSRITHLEAALREIITDATSLNHALTIAREGLK